MKLKLNNHSDWDKWLARLLKVTQDYALMLPLWIYGYKCLFSEHKMRPPPWICAWVETCMTMDNMTKEESKVWKLVKSRLAKDQAQLDVADKQDKASVNAAAVAATLGESQQRICELIDSKPSTCVITYRIPTEDGGTEQDLIQEFPDNDRFSIAKHVEEKLPRQCELGRPEGVLIFDGHNLVHSVQFFPYLLLELLKYSAPGVGTANLKTGTIIPSQVKDAPNWFIYFFQSNLPSEADAVDAQMMGLTLSTIGSQVWAKLIQEQANNSFSETVPQLYSSVVPVLDLNNWNSSRR